MKVEQYTDKGTGRMNEDVLLVAEPVFGAFDGVTSLDAFIDTDGRTGGLIAATLARDAFATSSTSLTATALTANAALEQAMRERHINTSKMESRWGTAAAVIRIQKDNIEWLRVADCSILFLLHDGGTLAIVDDSVLDKEMLHQCVAYAKSKTPKYRDKLLPLLREKRYHANQDYGVLNGDARLKQFIATGSVPRDNVRVILLSTDGFAFPKENPGQPDDNEYLLHTALRDGLMATAQEIRKLQNEDPECWRFPRFKKSDDIAAILIRL